MKKDKNREKQKVFYKLYVSKYRNYHCIYLPDLIFVQHIQFQADLK